MNCCCTLLTRFLCVYWPSFCKNYLVNSVLCEALARVSLRCFFNFKYSTWIMLRTLVVCGVIRYEIWHEEGLSRKQDNTFLIDMWTYMYVHLYVHTCTTHAYTYMHTHLLHTNTLFQPHPRFPLQTIHVLQLFIWSLKQCHCWRSSRIQGAQCHNAGSCKSSSHCVQGYNTCLRADTDIIVDSTLLILFWMKTDQDFEGAPTALKCKMCASWSQFWLLRISLPLQPAVWDLTDEDINKLLWLAFEKKGLSSLNVCTVSWQIGWIWASQRDCCTDVCTQWWIHGANWCSCPLGCVESSLCLEPYGRKGLHSVSRHSWNDGDPLRSVLTFEQKQLAPRLWPPSTCTTVLNKALKNATTVFRC